MPVRVQESVVAGVRVGDVLFGFVAVELRRGLALGERLLGNLPTAVVLFTAEGLAYANPAARDLFALSEETGRTPMQVLGVQALADAVAWGQRHGHITSRGKPVLTDSVAAVSVGIIDGTPMLDLPYEEDVRAETDMNVVVTGGGKFIEVQGTAEHAPFDRSELDTLLDLAVAGTTELTRLQNEALARELGA
jgi:ribonuclease PH